MQRLNYRTYQSDMLAKILMALFSQESHISQQEKCSLRKKSEKAREQFHFIPRHVHEIFEMLAATKKVYQHENPVRLEAPKLIDCGAGPGNVVLLASALGFDACGIEYDSKVVDRGRRILEMFGESSKEAEKRLFQGDILDYEDYGKYDVIYFFHPLRSSKKEREFEDRIAKAAKPGALIVGWGRDNGNAGPYKCWDGTPVFIRMIEVPILNKSYPVPIFQKLK
jgi:SAM-dependent methyltransferase